MTRKKKGTGAKGGKKKGGEREKPEIK